MLRSGFEQYKRISIGVAKEDELLLAHNFYAGVVELIGGAPRVIYGK
jgi:hypothetical protein